MNKPVIAVGAFLLGIALFVFFTYLASSEFSDTYTVERTDYRKPRVNDEPELADDRLADKNPAFDLELIDSRPIGDWELNASAAVIELDCPMLKPDHDAELLVLRPSYADAVSAAREKRLDLLPSANLLDGAAKQFDDGLYAALDLASFRGELGDAPGAVPLIAAIFNRLPQDSQTRPFLAAALHLAGEEVELTADEIVKRDGLLKRFKSKPLAFYNWTGELQQVWRFFRFLQGQQGRDTVTISIAEVLKNDPDLLQQYRAVNAFYGSLTNPMTCLTVDVLIDNETPLAELAKEHGVRHAYVAVFPPSTSRETELFEQLFPMGLPERANLMTALIKRIRSGEIDLAPDADAGWYQYQVHALQAMLRTDEIQESEKLLMTAAYKRRLIEAFKALMTKRRETHARQADVAAGSEAAPLGESEVRPRLRVEPCLTFYLRTARAYAFLQNFLTATVGPDRLAGMRGLRQGGQREMGLADELEAIKQRFYGFYLIGCEDIGMHPSFLSDEPVDQDAASQAALAWLENMERDTDLACDTRVSVPIYVDPIQGKARLWATLGVRLARLNARYARSPKVRPKEEGGQWQDVESYQLDTSHYVIPVDEFAEIGTTALSGLTRDEFRKVCDQHQTKEKIIAALSER